MHKGVSSLLDLEVGDLTGTAVPEGFRSLRQGGKYDNSNLVNVGRSAGKQAYDNLYISQVKFNFDFTPYWENLVKTRNL